MSDTIRLYVAPHQGATPVWEYHAKKHNDPCFSNFLSGMEEACGELPNELLLEGSVGDIILNGWSDYIALCQQYATVQAVRAVYNLNNSIPSHYSSPTRLICDFGTCTTLSRVGLIMRIVNAFPGWEMYVYTDRSSGEDSVKHLASMGEALYNAGVSLEDHRKLMIVHTAECDRADLGCEEKIVTMLKNIRDGMRASIGQGEKEEMYRIQLDKALVALLHNAYLLVSMSYSSCLTLYNIDWKYVPTLLTQLGCCVDENTAGYYLRELAAIFMGTGDVRKITAIPYLININSPHDSLYTTFHTSIARGDDLLRLYDATWSSVPEDVDPCDIGLVTFVHMPDRYGPAYSFMTLLREAHTIAERMATDGTYLEYDSIPTYVVALSITVAGREGLRRMRRCLKLYMKRKLDVLEPHEVMRITHFLMCAKKCLGWTLIDHTRHVEVTPHLVQYAKTRAHKLI